MICVLSKGTKSSLLAGECKCVFLGEGTAGIFMVFMCVFSHLGSDIWNINCVCVCVCVCVCGCLCTSGSGYVEYSYCVYLEGMAIILIVCVCVDKCSLVISHF